MKRILAIGVVVALASRVGSAQAQITPDPAPEPAKPARLPTLTLARAIDRAVARSADVHSATLEVRAASASTSGTKALYGPKLHVDANVTRFPEPQDTSFTLPGMTGPSPAFRVREATTTSLTVMLVQPLTALAVIHQAVRAQNLGLDVARLEVEVARRNVAFQTAQAYYRLLAADAIVAVSSGAAETMRSQLERTRRFQEQGLASKADLLRIEVAIARAEQGQRAAEGARELANMQLAVLIGAEPDEEIVPAPLGAPTPQAPPVTVAAAESEGLRSRIELRELDKRLGQAHANSKIENYKRFPQVNLIGSYSHTTGSTLQDENTAFVGVTLSWDVWDWGAQRKTAAAARAREAQVVASRSKVADAIRMDVRAAHVKYRIAAGQIAAAKKTVEQATENLRVVGERQAVQAASSFDVIDAEELLAEARGQEENAKVELAIAAADLRRAMGAPAAQIAGGKQ